MRDRIDMKRALRLQLDESESLYILQRSYEILKWINDYDRGVRIIHGQEWALYMISDTFSQNSGHSSAPWWYKEVEKVLDYDRIHPT